MSYISELNTPVRKRHILIVDDQMGQFANPDHMFKNCGIEVEVAYFRYSDDALEQLDTWAKQGIKPDVITCDDNIYGHGSDIGMETLKHFLPYLRDTYGPEFVPDKVFIHSAGAAHTHEIEGFGEPEWLRGSEFMDIAIWGEAEEDGILFATDHLFENTTLRAYCNEAWGTQFVLTQSAIEFLIDPNERLNPHTLYRLVTDEKEATPDEALRRMEISPENFINRYLLNNTHNVTKASFKDAIGNALVGVLAFNAEDVARLKQEKPDQPIVLCMQEYHPSLISLIQSVDGVILIGEGSEHLKVVLDNSDIPAVLGIHPEKTLFIGAVHSLSQPMIHLPLPVNAIMRAQKTLTTI